MINTVLGNYYVKNVLLSEKVSTKARKEVIDKIEKASGGRQIYQGYKNGAIRFKPKTKEDKIDGVNISIIWDRAGLTLSDIISVGAREAKSSKFPTYKVSDGTEDFYIIFAGGLHGNKGLSRELELAAETKAALNKNEKNLLLKALEEAGAFGDDDQPIDATQIPGKALPRPLSLNLSDVGPQIADLIIELESGKNVYVSLKIKSGTTFSSNGIGDTFKMVGDKVTFNPTGKFSEAVLALGVDPQLVVDGLNDYKDKVHTGERHVVTDPPNTDPIKIAQYIRSGFGYGYWYVMETKKDVYKIKDFTTKQKVEDFVKTAEVVGIKYPYYIDDMKSNKRCDVLIKASGDMGDMLIEAQIRNTQGGLVPQKMNLDIKKSSIVS